MTVVGSSMEPTITHNDIVVFVSPDQLKVGDIISYNYRLDNNEIVTIAHRIIEITNEGYITKGDSHNYIDNYIVPSDDITGIMWFKIPYIAAIGHFTQTIPGYLTLILIPSILLIIKEIKKLKRR